MKISPRLQREDSICTDREFLLGKSVLIIEDELLIAMNLESWLREAGAARVEVVHRLSSARDALNMESSFDVAVLDLMLADGDASPLTKVLRQLGIPFVITTGDASALAGSELTPSAAILVKPFPESELLAALRRAILPFEEGDRLGVEARA